ncbi:hypothetical protein [Pusillimonas minor]|uniref:Uncharacterized protein n=1 Tax=Pusillimonas minor TaxID=2697024 RepID=A0A842HTQ5_9BURK|nr:hypothetical protein [Pusillimonas minor]MBC2770601.1 hypothetical protein [Pusillimonas minor]
MKTRIVRALMRAQAPSKEMLERSMLLHASLLDNANLSKPVLRSLHAAEYRVFSQWGEDGIVAWLVEQLEGIPRSFVEFGVEDYQESNTRYLLQSRNWRGLVIDGSSENVAEIRRQDFCWRHELTTVCAFIDRDNINALIGNNGFKGDIGLLSVDIDGNDYWVWQAIDVISPAIVVCEYNAVLGDRLALTVPYKSDFRRSVAHHSCLYFGASIRAMIQLGEQKRYTFVGTTSTGCNAFFVRNDYAPRITSRLDYVSMFPSSIREARDQTGALQYTSGTERADVIAGLPFVEVETGHITTLAAHRMLYSPAWAAGNPVAQPVSVENVSK